MVISDKKTRVNGCVVVFLALIFSACSQSSSLPVTKETKMINGKIQSVENSLTNDNIIIKRISEHIKSFDWPHSITPSIYEPDDKIFLTHPKDELDILQLELAKTVFTQVKAIKDYDGLIYFSKEYIRDSSDNIIAVSMVVACENKIDACFKIHEEMIEKGITSIFKNFGDNWTIVGYYSVW